MVLMDSPIWKMVRKIEKGAKRLHTEADKIADNGCHRSSVFQTKTGFGVHVVDEKTLTPRSCTGQIM